MSDELLKRSKNDRRAFAICLMFFMFCLYSTISFWPGFVSHNEFHNYTYLIAIITGLSCFICIPYLLISKDPKKNGMVQKWHYFMLAAASMFGLECLFRFFMTLVLMIYIARIIELIFVFLIVYEHYRMFRKSRKADEETTEKKSQT
jgi:hypothetical protein